MRLQHGRCLAEVVQTRERTPRQAAREADEPRGAHLEQRARALGSCLLEQKLGVETIPGQGPPEAPGWIDCADQERPAVAGAAEEGRPIVRAHRPPCALGESTSV